MKPSYGHISSCNNQLSCGFLNKNWHASYPGARGKYHKSYFSMLTLATGKQANIFWSLSFRKHVSYGHKYFGECFIQTESKSTLRCCTLCMVDNFENIQIFVPMTKHRQLVLECLLFAVV